MRQRNLDRVREVGGELVEVRRVRTVPGVDGLARVAHYAQIRLRAHEHLEQGELQCVDVLELVDKDVSVAPLERGDRVFVLLEEAATQDQNVVEVDQVALDLRLFIGLVNLGHTLGGQLHRARIVGSRSDVGIGLDTSGLGPFDLRNQVEGNRSLSNAWH